MSPDRDEILADLVNRLSEQMRMTGVADVDAVASEHPELAAELRNLWAIAQFAGLAKSNSATLPRRDPLLEAPTTQALPKPFGEFELRRELGV